MKFKKALAIGLVSLMGITTLAGCSSSSDKSDKKTSSNKDVVKIGVIAPTTGSVSVYGKSAINGYKVAVEEYNKDGGVLGKKIELVIYDDKGDITEAKNAYQKLIDNDKVDAILGGIISTNTLTVAELAAEDGIPMITPTATAADITTQGDNIFRSCFTDPFQGKKAAEYATTELKGKKAAILFEEGDYGQGLAKSFEETFKKDGGKITSKKGYNPKDKDFKSILTEIKSQNADILFIPGYYNSVALIGAQAQEVGIEAKLLGGDGWDGVIDVDPKAVEGGYFANHYSVDDPREVVQNFVKSYKEANKNEVPKSFAALGYDSAKTLFEAMKSAKSTEWDKVVPAIQKTDLELVSGKTKFDKNGDPIKNVTILQVVDGKYKFIKNFK